MLRQLARLTHPVDACPGGVAIAVYADAAGVPIAATDRGYEGVACVDDAARALVLMCDLWTATRAPIAREWAAALLEFLLYMQDDAGRFVNFVVDWSGVRNEGGPTSIAGGGFWQARGVHALARACRDLDAPRVRQGAVRGIEQIARSEAPPNVRAIHILAAIELLRAGVASDLVPRLELWCEELVQRRVGGVLFDDPDQHAPHLWGHIQEGALAEAGSYLGRPDLVQVSAESALRYLAPLIDSGFDVPSMQPNGVACAVFDVERLAAVTGDPRWARHTEHARAWFDHRNPAGHPVYDRVAGKVRDGVDGGVLNRHSGAESNIVAGQALFAQAARGITVHGAAIERAWDRDRAGGDTTLPRILGTVVPRSTPAR